MIITIASLKGGVGKTTTAIHLAQYFSTTKPKKSVVLLDADSNRTVIDWATESLPFVIKTDPDDVSECDLLIVDTAARPSDQDLSDLVKQSDLIIIPSRADAFDVRATLTLAQALKPWPSRYRILLTGLPPRGKKLADEARAMFEQSGLMIFDGGIKTYAVYREATYAGKPVSAMGDPGKVAFKDYQAIALQIKEGWL